jgi:hypothetical protein
VRTELRRFGGREVDTAGDGFLAAFDRPAEAVRCAAAIVERVQELGIDVRAGVHIGEAEVMGRKVGGMVVHTGARITQVAGPGTVLASETLRRLVPGARFGFEDHGVHRLKGVPEEHRLFVVSEVDGNRLAGPLASEEAARRREEIVPPPVRRRMGAAAGVVIVVAAAVGIAVAVLRPERAPRPPAPLHGAVVRLDPETGQVVQTIRGLPVGEGARTAQGVRPQLLAGEGGVWLLLVRGLLHIDPSTGTETVVRLSNRPGDVALGHRAVWTVPHGIGLAGTSVSGVDTSTLEEDVVTQLAEPQQVSHFRVATTSDRVWVVAGRDLLGIEPLSGDVEKEIALGYAADDLGAIGDDLLITDELDDLVVRFVPERGRAAETWQLQADPDVLATGADGSVWVLNLGGGAVTSLGPSGSVGAPIRVGSHSSDIAVGPDAVWVSDIDSGVVRRIDPELGREVDQLPVRGRPAAVAVDPVTGDLWVYLA